MDKNHAVNNEILLSNKSVKWGRPGVSSIPPCYSNSLLVPTHGFWKKELYCCRGVPVSSSS
jgi:hypothetical protein